MNKKILITIGIIFASVCVFLIYLQISESNQLPKITNSIPADNSTGVSVTDPINITFDKNIEISNMTITSTPTETWTVTRNNPNSIQVLHSLYLKVATNYKLTVFQNGNTIGTINFETQHEQNDPRLLQNLKSELDKDYPLAKITPYETNDFKVIYTAALTFEIDLKSNISQQEAITQVQSWVRSNGIDPTTHKYIVKTSTNR